MSAITGKIGPYADIENASTPFLESLVEKLQNLQKSHRPDSIAWNQASEMLSPIFRELARRQEAGEL